MSAWDSPYHRDVPSPGSQSILIVEDDEGIGNGLVRALDGAGHVPTWCRDAGTALGQRFEDFDLILLDLGLPDIDGVDLCRRLRRDLTQVPIIILTVRGSEADVVVGLDAGADDYLVKPFRLAELLARIRALGRRGNVDHDDTVVLNVGDITVDTDARRVSVGRENVELRPKEFDLLVVLMTNAGKALSREFLMTQVWDQHYFGSTKTLDVHIAALRRRFGEPGPERSRITTLRGIGYRLQVQEQSEHTR